MRYETSYEVMVGDERHIWEDLLENSTELLKSLKGYKGSGECLVKYISLLFGLRCANDSRKELMNKVNEIDKEMSSGKFNDVEIDNYHFQKWLKYYLGDIDSVLDYMDKLSLSLMGYHELKWDEVEQKNTKDKFYFNRKDHKIADEVNEMRNSLLHEGLPIIETDAYKINGNSPCQAQAAGCSKIFSNINITFRIRKSDEITKDLRNYLLKYIYLETHKLVSEFIDKLINSLK